jgi:hypothetical protein
MLASRWYHRLYKSLQFGLQREHTSVPSYAEVNTIIRESDIQRRDAITATTSGETGFSIDRFKRPRVIQQFKLGINDSLITLAKVDS